MNHSFVLSCESTVDLPYSYVSGRGIEVLFYSYSVAGKTYPDDMGRDEQALPRFYQFIKQGKLPTTSQINTYTYYDYFLELLKKGDVLHIALGSGMTPSVRNAAQAAEMLKEKVFEHRVVVVDSLSSCGGYGLLVDNIADMWDKGCSIEAAESYALEARKYTEHQFFSSDLRQFRRSGRVSGVAAAAATVLGICPIMHLDAKGQIIAYDKVRGKTKAIEETVNAMAKNAAGGTDYCGKCFVNHSNCLSDAEATVALIKQTFPKLKDIRVNDIGTIIGSHAGPGTVAVFFMGEKPKQD